MMRGTLVDGVDAAPVEISGSDDAPQIREKTFALFTPSNATVDRVGCMSFQPVELCARSSLSVIEKPGRLTPSARMARPSGMRRSPKARKASPSAIPCRSARAR